MGKTQTDTLSRRRLLAKMVLGASLAWAAPAMAGFDVARASGVSHGNSGGQSRGGSRGTSGGTSGGTSRGTSRGNSRGGSRGENSGPSRGQVSRG